MTLLETQSDQTSAPGAPRSPRELAVAVLASALLLVQIYAFAWPLHQIGLPMGRLLHQFLPAFVPTLACDLLIVVLVWSRRWWVGGLAALVPVAATLLASLCGAAVVVVQHPELSLWWSYVGPLLASTAVSVAALVVGWPLGRLTWTWSRSWLSLTVAAAAGAAVVAHLLPWVRSTFASAGLQLGTGLPDNVSECCAAYAGAASLQWVSTTIGLLCVLALGLLLPHLLPRWAAGAAVVAQGLILLAQPIYQVVQALWADDPIASGMTMQVLPGAWLALGAALVTLGAGLVWWVQASSSQQAERDAGLGSIAAPTAAPAE